MSRLKEDCNLLRSHYYFLIKKYQFYAVPLVVNGVTAYLHKGPRGYSYNHFTHTEFKSLIRILGFKFFNFKYTNLESIISKCSNWEDCEYIMLDDSSTETNQHKKKLHVKKSDTINRSSLTIQNQEIYTKMNRQMKDVFFKNVDISNFQERNLGIPLDGKLPIIEIVKNHQEGESHKNILIKRQSPNNQKNHLNLIAFYKYINASLEANVSYILQNCITSVYKDLNIKYEFYKIHGNLNVFQMDILPTPADYITAFKLFDYIENIHNVSEKYKHPTMVI